MKKKINNILNTFVTLNSSEFESFYNILKSIYFEKNDVF